MEHIHVDNESKPVNLVRVVKSKHSYCARCFKKLEYTGKRSTFCPECLEIEKENGPKIVALALPCYLLCQDGGTRTLSKTKKH